MASLQQSSQGEYSLDAQKDKRYKQRRIKASVSVNQEMIGFYWSIGRDIVEKSAESKWGSGFFVNLSVTVQNPVS